MGVGPFIISMGPPAGTLLYADPGVKIERPGKGLITYSAGMELVTGDTVETTQGQAVIDYDDDNAVMLTRATRVQLGSITLFFGELFAKIKSIAKKGGGQVVTNELSASVAGTEYGVRRSLVYPPAPVGNVEVYVRQGRVLCAPGAGARWSPIGLTDNLALDVSGDRAAPAPRSVDARALSRWADEAEQRLRKPRKGGTGIGVGIQHRPDRPRGHSIDSKRPDPSPRSPPTRFHSPNRQPP